MKSTKSNKMGGAHTRHTHTHLYMRAHTHTYFFCKWGESVTQLSPSTSCPAPPSWSPILRGAHRHDNLLNNALLHGMLGVKRSSGAHTYCSVFTLQRASILHIHSTLFSPWSPLMFRFLSPKYPWSLPPFLQSTAIFVMFSRKKYLNILKRLSSWISANAIK